MIFSLPFPPTVNTYWRRVGSRTLISKRGRRFRSEVDIAMLNVSRGSVAFPCERLRVQVDVYPPDKRRRDLDNLGKALLDAMQHAGVYGDDSQIDHLEFVRREVEPPGRVVVLVEEMKE